MNRYLFFTIQLMIAVCLAAVPIQAASVPTLQTTSKYRPDNRQQKRVLVTPASHTVSLGRLGDISSVKASVKAQARVQNTARHAPRKSSKSNKAIYLSRINKRITSKCVMILNADTGETIFSKAADTPRQPASTIKVLTGMIAIKSLQKNELVGVTRKAQKMPRSKVYLDTKKKYKADDLINAVLLASANDASVALAEKIAGSEQAFATMMTQRARLWGATRTICRTANGLTAKGQQSTARDLAKIFRHAMKNKDFAKRMKYRKVKTSYGTTLYTHNKALWKVKGAVAGKTGYTNAARQTYVGQFTRGDDTIVLAIMGSETMWTDVKRLVDYGFKKNENMKLARLAQAGD